MNDEELEWYALSPAGRFAESQKLWEVFLRFGGSLDPEPDTQSPFYSLYFGDEGPEEEDREKEQDRQYWTPLKAELERWRHRRRP